MAEILPRKHWGLGIRQLRLCEILCALGQLLLWAQHLQPVYASTAGGPAAGTLLHPLLPWAKSSRQGALLYMWENGAPWAAGACMSDILLYWTYKNWLFELRGQPRELWEVWLHTQCPA